MADYPAEMPGVVDLGAGHYLLWDDVGNFIWHHPACRSWSPVRFVGPEPTGHELVGRDPLTVGGSLLCPMGCGDHGWIRDGKWVPA